MITAKIRWPLYLIILLFTAGCATSSDSGHALSPSLTGSIQADPINTEQIQNFTRSVRPVNGELDAKYKLATHFQRIRQHRLALQILAEVIRQAPGHAMAHNAMGYSYDSIKEYQKAQYHYRMAIALAPDMAQAYNNLGFSCILNKDYTAATEALKQAIALDEDNIKYHNNLALAYLQSGEADMAASTFEKAKAAPDVAESREKPGRIVDSPAIAASPSTEPAAASPLLDVDSPDQSNPSPDGQNSISIKMPSTEGQIHAEPIQMPRVEISNGNGITGMARTVANYLKNKGINRSRLTNADHFGYGATVIYYRDGYYSQAVRIKNLLPGMDDRNRLVENQLARDPIRILVGKDFSPVESQDRADICVDICNGNGIRGMAKRLGRHISLEGFRVGRLTNADHFKYARTTVFYSQGRGEQARLVAQALPGQVDSRLVELSNTGERIQLRLGSDYIF